MSAPWNFARFLPLAERLLSRGRLPALLFAVARKGPRLGQLREDVKLLQSLCLAWWRGVPCHQPQGTGHCRGWPAVFRQPYRCHPGLVAGVGFLDDIAVLGWVLKTVADELARFKAWRDSQAPERLRVVERLPATPEALQLERNK